ncbi:LutC/YkgG family protein [Thalassotalea sp. ND16A]|uniref:LutC/YkgG family protein n=1 Tax=Thalassotalea sp. ND16A TaxID=1535422 RepID=UPI00051A6CD2|nr:lactate utilization protein [Thalassotalea sp. ND16A]KGK00585.1 hypothetical protein ND16A_3345 [Thalassotalea sp. ND16A]
MSTNIKLQSNVAKSSILDKLKSQVKGADYSKLPAEPSYQYPQLSKEQQLAQFIGHLQANHAQVIQLEQAQIAETVSNELKDRGIKKLLYGTQAAHSAHMAELDADINTDISAEVFDFNLAGNKEKLFNDTPASITSSRAAIAATGSIVLWPTVTEPRSLSLVPPVHFVIVDAERLYATFATLIKEQQWQDKLPTNAILVSGPSKTADIQQTLAYGAHGPKELIVLLINS